MRVIAWIFFLLGSSVAWAEPFQSPLHGVWNGTQAFGAQDCGDDGYHKALDLAQPAGNLVYPVHSGVVVGVRYSHLGDHGMGRTVVVRHNHDGQPIYSQYSHLHRFSDAIRARCPNSAPEPEAPVYCGESGSPLEVGVNDSLGIIGGSGYGIDTRWTTHPSLRRPQGPHLHLEFLRQNPDSSDSMGMGYQADNVFVENSNVLDPVRYIENVTAENGQLVSATDYGADPGDPAPVRIGPGTHYEVISGLQAGNYNLINTAPADSACPNPWWQIDGSSFDYAACPGRGRTSRGWVCSNDGINPNLIRQQIESGSQVSLVLDQSGSMRERALRADGTNVGSRLDVAKRALRAFVDTLDDFDQVSISAFSNRAQTHIAMSGGTVGPLRPRLATELQAIGIAGGTNIGAGLEAGLNQLPDSGADQYALLLSDGENTTGRWEPVVQQYVNRGIPVCTIGFGTQRGEPELRRIAQMTNCTYSYAEADNLISAYQEMGAYAQHRSEVLAISDALAPDADGSYPLTVNTGSSSLRVYSSWAGSRLRIRLKDPAGTIHDEKSAARFRNGSSYQLLEIANPAAGEWQLMAEWSEPPTTTEQVNINVTEKNDVFLRMGGIRPHYQIGQSVDFELAVMEVLNNRKEQLRNVSVEVIINKPQEEMIRLVQARSSNWTMFKDVVQDVVRHIDLNSDPTGKFSGRFSETDVNGPFVYEVKIVGQKSSGEALTRSITGSFQVGSILQNRVKTSDVMMFQERVVPKEISLEDLLSDDSIYDLESELEESDALDSLNDLLQ
jgi:hypothetical protein